MKFTVRAVYSYIVKWYIICSFIDISTTTENCQDPDNLLELATKLAVSNIDFHNSYYMLEPLRDAIRSKEGHYHNISKNFKGTFNMKIHGEKECPKYLKPSSKHMASTCPVFWELTYDTARVPRTIVQAHCACKKCLVTEDKSYLRDRMNEYECRPIFFYERVLRKIGCDPSNVFIYKPVTEPIRVGCTCAIPIEKS